MRPHRRKTAMMKQKPDRDPYLIDFRYENRSSS
jgi:hypothetical protein